MKTTMLITTLILSFQTMANDIELKNRMQMVCIGSSEKRNIIVLTQRDPEIDLGKELFNYIQQHDDSEEIAEINNVKLVLEIYEPQENEKENIEQMDEEQLRSKILESKFAKRLARFDGHGSRMERFFNFQDKETKSNQLRINLDNIKNVGYAYSEYSDGFECRKAYETTYSPLDDPKPEMEDKSGTIQLAEIQDGDPCIVGVDKECVEGAPITSN